MARESSSCHNLPNLGFGIELRTSFDATDKYWRFLTSFIALLKEPKEQDEPRRDINFLGRGAAAAIKR